MKLEFQLIFFYEFFNKKKIIRNNNFYLNTLLTGGWMESTDTAKDLNTLQIKIPEFQEHLQRLQKLMTKTGFFIKF